MNVLIINGPNLNLLGKREPEIYGSSSFESFLAELSQKFSSVNIEYFQSNIEGEIIDKIQEKGFSYEGIVLNAGAYTHTSIAISDAIKAITTPVIEVHLSNVFAREKYRHESFLTPVCVGCISGLGLNSYKLALQAFVDKG